MLTGDAALLELIARKWDNMASKKMYLTGGMASARTARATATTTNCPTRPPTCETCAAIANALWSAPSSRPRPTQVPRRAGTDVYNGCSPASRSSGDRFFYVNPLAADGASGFNQGANSPFPLDGLGLLPDNVPRFLPQLPGCLYATRDDALYVNLFAGSVAKVKLGERTVKLVQETRYPWDGKVRITVEPQRRGPLPVRVASPAGPWAGPCQATCIAISTPRRARSGWPSTARSSP